MPHNKKFYSCASAIALSVMLAQSARAEDMAVTAAPVAAPAATAAPAPEATAPAAVAASTTATAPTAAPVPAAPTMPAPPAPPPEIAKMRAEADKMMNMTPEERWESRRKELNERYMELRARAVTAGMELPETPAWDRAADMTPPAMPERPTMPAAPEHPAGILSEPPMPRAWGRGMGPGRMLMSDEERRANRAALSSMTPEEREAFQDKHYQEMRARAAEKGMELPETPPWKQSRRDMPEPPPMPEMPDMEKIQAVIDGMSPEEREACMTMHRMHMRSMQSQPRPMPPAQGGYGRGYGYGPGMGYGRPGYGHGQGHQCRGYGCGWGQ